VPPEPAVPEPAVPEPAVPEPAVPEPAVPLPPAPVVPACGSVPAVDVVPAALGLGVVSSLLHAANAPTVAKASPIP
jgi:Meckel syndrome type 1 protein